MSDDPVTTAPICSVCIANYNGEDLIAACIDSVLAQEVKGTIEILVHDDASDDRSVALIEERYPQVRLLRSEQNVGFCVANNRMAAEAGGRYLLLLNNDAVLRSGALAALSREASRGFDGVLGLAEYSLPEGNLVSRGYFLDPFANPVPNFDADVRSVAMVSGACLWIPRRLWRQVGGFPSWFGSLAEDVYLCLAVRAMGHGVRVVSDLAFDHRVGASFGGGRPGSRPRTTRRRRALSERNRTFVLVLFYPLAALVFLLPIRMTWLLLEGMLISSLRVSWSPWQEIYWPALMAPLRKWRELCAERSRIVSRGRLRLKDLAGVSRPIPWKLRMLFRYGVPGLN